MVRIKKNNLVLTVPYSAFKNIYEPNGWSMRVRKENTKVERTGENSFVETEIEGMESEVDLSSMNLSELREFAARNGIDISEGNTKKEIRSIIEMAMDI